MSSAGGVNGAEGPSRRRGRLAAVPVVVAAVRAALGIDEEPAWTEVQRWTFARPAAPRDEPFGLVDGIGLGGDGWHAPAKVESAWRSGDALGRALAG